MYIHSSFKEGLPTCARGLAIDASVSVWGDAYVSWDVYVLNTVIPGHDYRRTGHTGLASALNGLVKNHG